MDKFGFSGQLIEQARCRGERRRSGCRLSQQANKSPARPLISALGHQHEDLQEATRALNVPRVTDVAVRNQSDCSAVLI